MLLPVEPCSITMSDPSDPDANSGGPARCVRELGKDFPNLSQLWPGPISLQPGWARALPGSLRRRLFGFDGLLQGVEHLSPTRTERAVLARATRLSQATEAKIRALGREPDLIIGLFVCWPLYGLRPGSRLVYFTDGTSKQINESYYYFQARSEGYHRACQTIERQTLERSKIIGVAAEAAKRSCVNDYGIDPSRVRVIPMGANVFPESPLRDASGVTAPGRHDLRLSMVASDIRRKRTDFAVEVVERARAMGWNATLHLIGTPTARARASSAVKCLGPLRLSSEADRKRHQQTMRDCHLMILPSEAECYGIAPAEAAHFARPSVVSEAGGLPDVVLHERTGLVMPMRASALDYAAALVGLVSDEARYRAMCEAALDRAQSVLNWEAWRRGMREMIAEAMEMP